MEQPVLSSLSLEIPEDITCPITRQIMTDPVILVESGHTYEREAILKHLQRRKTDPLTNQIIVSTMLAPNHMAKKLISSFLDQQKKIHPNITDETYLPESLIQTLLTVMQKNDKKGFAETLQKDNRLLINRLKENKNVLMLACESATVEILEIILAKLGVQIKTLEGVKSDSGLSLFLKVSRRLGLSGAMVMTKALGWEASDLQGLLVLAVQNDEVSLAQIALSLGAVATVDLLNDAYVRKATEMVKALLQSKFSLVETEDQQGNDFLMHTLVDGYHELTLFLLTAGQNALNPNKTNRAGQSALHLIVEQTQIDLMVVDTLLSHPKINANQTNKQQETALHLATRRGYLPVVERLIQKGISVNAKNQDGKTALDVAYDQYDKGNFAVLKHLVLSGASLEDLLLKAIATNQSELIQFLLREAKSMVNPNITNMDGKPTLLLAIEKNQLETVSLLLSHPKINIIQTDQVGNTGLHFAAMSGNEAMVKLLMKYHLSIKDKNKDRKTPVQLARGQGHAALANWMEEKHRYKKIKPFLKPIQVKLEEQQQVNQSLKSEIDQEKKTNQAQSIEIQSQKTKLRQLEELEKTHQTEEKVSQQQIQLLKGENNQLRGKLRQLEENLGKQSANLNELSIFSAKYGQSLMTVAEKAQRKQQERERWMQNSLQNELVAACLEGNVDLVKQLELKGGSLLCPNRAGLYPLVGAVYGCNFEMVRYVESKLKGEALKQWREVNTEEAMSRLEKNTPTQLGEGATYGDVANWYVKHAGSSWCAYYDAACLKHLKRTNWGDLDISDGWKNKGLRIQWCLDKNIISQKRDINASDDNLVKLRTRMNLQDAEAELDRRHNSYRDRESDSYKEAKKDFSRWYHFLYYSPKDLQDAGSKVDRIVINEIREQLEALKNDVVTKTKSSSSVVGLSKKT